ncbi:unnamed protein product [Caenorhabditis bovis]|uniref:Nucleolar complex protein 2 homolog n=1 Tax=Caenorhabditis bovis TaxID=2654633 RepID=A0A8S1F0L7_9PELO|nr:unnamed protein product [Caenorhabditis bovis]
MSSTTKVRSSKKLSKKIVEQKDEAQLSKLNSKEGESSDDEEVAPQNMKKHKLDLEKLKETDPEFFKFLQQEDADLLQLDDDDDDDDDESDDGEQSDEEEEELDEEDEAKNVKKMVKAKVDSASGRFIVDSRVYAYLQQVLDPADENVKITSSDIRMAIDVFVACVARVGADIEAPKYVINEQTIFEAVVRLCFQTMPDAFNKLLKAKKVEKKTIFSKSALRKYQGYIRTYLHAVIVFLNEVQTNEVIISTLKAITRLIDFYANFTKMAKLFVKATTRIWSRKTLECRVAAYVCMNLMVQNYPQHFVMLYKAAYVAFVANSKVVTNETWPLLQFMHRTFAELTIQYPDQAYKYAFVYIRQTGVHLRNAMIAKGRKDLVFSIYNWQMMQCMYIWVRVIAKAHSVNGAEAIGELVYPLIQIIIGIFRLCNAPTFLPLRIHCCQLLIQLQASCTNYIPILQLSCDVLDELCRELRKKPEHSKGVVKLPDIECTLKISSQYSNLPQWRKITAESVFRVMMQSAHLLASQAAFPDVVLPFTHRVNSLLAEIKNGDYAHLFKGLIAKITEHSKFVLEVLARKDVRVNDEMQVLAVRFELNNPDSPIKLYYRQWEKVWKAKQETLMNKNAAEKKEKEEKKNKKRKADDEEDVESLEEKHQVPKQKRKRAKIGAAAKKADASLPDKFADLENWSDNDD